MKSTLPELELSTELPHHLNLYNKVAEKNYIAKLKMKHYADSKRHTAESKINVGDTVFIKQQKN